MNVGNKYILRLHYNNFDQKNSGANTNPHNSNNGSLYYHVAGGISQPYSLIALYDDSFAGRYTTDSINGNNLSIYGSLTSNGSYSFTKQGISVSTFKFFSIHPEKYIHSGSGMEDVKFLCNEVNSASTDELFLVGLSDGLALIKKSGQSSDHVDFVINRKLVYDYDTGTFNRSNNMHDQRESVIIPKSDIDPEVGKDIEVGRIYKIKATTANAPVTIYDAGDNSVGTLKSSTILVTKDSYGPALVVAHGAGEIHNHDLIGGLQLDTITLYRDETSGEFKYYFSDRKGKETSNANLVDYCNSSITGNENNCKMEDLNLFPNVRAYIKSTLVSGDIADFGSQGNVDAASVALILKRTVIDDIAQALANAKSKDLATAIFQTSMSALNGKTLTQYIYQDLPEKIAQKQAVQQAVQQAVVAALKNNPGIQGPQGLQGNPGAAGQNGQDANPVEVAKELVTTNKVLALVTAVLKATDKNGEKLLNKVAKDPTFQTDISGILKKDPGNARGPEGPPGIQGNTGAAGQDANPVEVAKELVTNKADELGKVLLHTTSATLKGKTITEYVDQDMSKDVANELKKDPGMKGPQGDKGEPGQDADPVEVTHRLAHNTRFKRSLKGDDGADGAPGSRGRAGATGKKGEDADPAQVAEELVKQPNQHQLVNAIFQTSSGVLNNKTIIQYVEQDMPKKIAQEQDIQQAVANELKSDPGMKGPAGPAGRDADPVEVTHRLAHNSRFKRSLKGDDGADGAPGPTGQSGPKGDSAEVANKVAKDPSFQIGISDILKRDFNFQRDIKGDPGQDGAPGPAGQDGRDADPVEVTHRLAHNARFKRSLKGEDGADGKRGENGTPGLQGPTGPQGPEGKPGPTGQQGPQGEPGKDSVDSFPLDSESKRSIRELQKKPQLKIVPGEPYNENIQKANIELDGVGVIATFLEIGYFFKNDDLYIRDHITGNNILIPKRFHFLTVVEDGFDNYKLAFCNNLGNVFFNYQKYAPEYAGVLEEYKLIDLKYIENAANIDLSKYYYHHIHTPLFAVRKGEPEGQSLENYGVDVYEIARNKKIGTLVDEFGFFERDQFHYVNHHQGYDHHSQEPNVRIENHEGNFQIGDHIIHPIILHDGRFDLLDYLSYS